jgi:hypothetical protein
MKTQWIIAGVALAYGAGALAQTPPPATDRSGGPTATAGSSAQSNAPTSSTGASVAAKKTVHHRASHKAKPSDASTTQLPDGTDGASTPSGR